VIRQLVACCIPDGPGASLELDWAGDYDDDLIDAGWEPHIHNERGEGPHVWDAEADWPHADGVFGVVLCLHRGSDEVFREAHRVLSEGGHIIAGVHEGASLVPLSRHGFIPIVTIRGICVLARKVAPVQVH
jgi:SAM-dependent methyltransferase